VTADQAIANGKRDGMLGPEGTRVLIAELERLRSLLVLHGIPMRVGDVGPTTSMEPVS
jgi:hypothetical protein